LQTLLDLRPEHTLADLCRNVDRLDRNMFQQALVHHASGAHLLAPPDAFAEAADITLPGVAPGAGPRP